MNKLGIMQGRVTEKGGFFPQQFPAKQWQAEFSAAKKLNIQCIEWMFNFDDFEHNPLFTETGRQEIKTIAARTGVTVPSVCANYFMHHSFFRNPKQAEGQRIFRLLLDALKDIGAGILVLPLFEDNEPKEHEMDDFCKNLLQMTTLAERANIKLALETDLDAGDCLKIMEQVPAYNLGFCYDLGNAAGLGKDIDAELHSLTGRLWEIHLKDKPHQGTTVMLGDGDVDFHKVREILNDIRYDGPLILESYYVNALEDTKKNAAIAFGIFNNKNEDPDS